MLNRLAAAAFATMLISVSALAQTPPPAMQVASITAEQAISIARQQGLVSVEDVDRDDGKWEVEGKDVNGREIEVEPFDQDDIGDGQGRQHGLPL